MPDDILQKRFLEQREIFSVPQNLVITGCAEHTAKFLRAGGVVPEEDKKIFGSFSFDFALRNSRGVISRLYECKLNGEELTDTQLQTVLYLFMLFSALAEVSWLIEGFAYGFIEYTRQLGENLVAQEVLALLEQINKEAINE